MPGQIEEHREHDRDGGCTRVLVALRSLPEETGPTTCRSHSTCVLSSPTRCRRGPRKRHIRSAPNALAHGLNRRQEGIYQGLFTWLRPTDLADSLRPALKTLKNVRKACRRLPSQRAPGLRQQRRQQWPHGSTRALRDAGRHRIEEHPKIVEFCLGGILFRLSPGPSHGGPMVSVAHGPVQGIQIALLLREPLAEQRDQCACAI